MARKPTGTVQWSGDHWRARVTLEDGSRPWLDLPASIGEHERERAKAKAAELAKYARDHGMRRAARGRTVSNAETVSEYAERWLSQRERDGLRAVRDDRGRLATHILPMIGALPLAEVTERDCRSVVAALDAKAREGSLAWRTAIAVWAVFAKLLDDACHAKVEALRVLTSNPAKDVRPPDRGALRARCYLYPSEFLRLVSCVAIPVRWRRVYAVAVYTYARAGELEALRRADVDLAHGVIRVHRQSDRYTGEAIATKTKATRAVPIEPTLRPLLDALTRSAGDGAIVKLAPREFGAAYLRKHLRAAGLDREELYADDETRAPLTFHDLRATGITWRAVRGDEPLKIQRSAGHSSFATTDRYIREADNVRAGFGDVFPALPSELCEGDERDPHGGEPDGEGPSIRPAKCLFSADEATSERDLVAENTGQSETEQGASLTRFENVDARLTLSKPSETRVIALAPTTPNPSESPRSVMPGDASRTALATPRAALARALSEAVRFGLEAGDLQLVKIASRALAELVG